MDQLSELSKELDYPSAQKLWIEAQRRQLEVTRKQVVEFVKTQAVRQVFRQRKAISGRIVATEIMDRWAADLIDYNARPSQDPKGGEPYQYILIVQDIFSRKLWAHALKVKSQEVVQQAFEAIVRRAGTPDNLDTDNGHEFKGRFQDYLVEENVQHDVADPRSKNARATLDAAIKRIRQQLARIQLAEGNRAWASVLQRAVEAYNRTVHSSLIGRAPQNVYWDKVLQFDLRSKAADDIAHNTRAQRFRENNLERLGAFRDELLPGTKFERAFKPKYGDEVHRVVGFEGDMVVDEQGRSFPTRHVMPVPPGSSAVDTTGMHGGSERIDRVRLQSLEPYRRRIEEFVGQGKTENEVVRYMKSLHALSSCFHCFLSCAALSYLALHCPALFSKKYIRITKHSRCCCLLPFGRGL